MAVILSDGLSLEGHGSVRATLALFGDGARPLAGRTSLALGHDVNESLPEQNLFHQDFFEAPQWLNRTTNSIHSSVSTKAWFSERQQDSNAP